MTERGGGTEPRYGDYTKTYPAAAKTRLPKPDHSGLRVEEAIRRRRTDRKFSEEPVSLGELSQVLYSAAGKTNENMGQVLRTAPSAGALYPVELYVLANRADGLDPGIYHYSVMGHCLELVKRGDFGRSATEVSLEQSAIASSAATFVMSAVFERSRKKYGKRCERYAYIEAGHISQNVYLQALSLGLGSGVIGAFRDRDWNNLLELDGKRETVIYLHAFGRL